MADEADRLADARLWAWLKVFNNNKGENMSGIANRRAEDERINQLVGDVDALKLEMKKNTEATMAVLDMLATFRVISSVARWLAALAAGVAGLVYMIKTGDFQVRK